MSCRSFSLNLVNVHLSRYLYFRANFHFQFSLIICARLIEFKVQVGSIKRVAQMDQLYTFFKNRPPGFSAMPFLRIVIFLF